MGEVGLYLSQNRCQGCCAPPKAAFALDIWSGLRPFMINPPQGTERLFSFHTREQNPYIAISPYVKVEKGVFIWLYGPSCVRHREERITPPQRTYPSNEN